MIIVPRSNNPYEHLTTKLLVSCPRSPKSKGGLYILDFSLNNISKILEGDCRGVVRSSDGFYVATNSHGILKLDKAFNVTNQYSASGLDLHGLKVDSSNLLYAVETKHNRIGIYQTNPFKRIDEIQISPSDTDENHINDIWIEENRILVSMFSLNGGWRHIKGNYDGVIAEYCLQSKSLQHVLFNNLQLPHSIIRLGVETYYCESFSMNLKKEGNVLAAFNGFTRGLAYDGHNFYIGQSEMRHLEKILTQNNNVSMDCGIHVFDPDSKTNRFIQFPEDQIYEIFVLDEDITGNIPLKINLTDSTANRFLNCDQWYQAESNHRWMRSKTVQIKFASCIACKSVVIEAYNGYPGQFDVLISINNKNTCNISFEANEFKKIEIKIDESDLILLQLDIEKLWVPDEVYGNGDNRSLGLAIRTINLL